MKAQVEWEHMAVAVHEIALQKEKKLQTARMKMTNKLNIKKEPPRQCKCQAIMAAELLNGDLTAGINTIRYGIVMLETVERQGRIVIVETFELVEVGLYVGKKHVYFGDNQFRWPVWLDCESLSYLTRFVSMSA